MVAMKNQNTVNERNENQNQTIIFESIAPHPQPVVIGELLMEIEAAIKRHVVLSDAAATALAVWVLHTYVFELRDTVAYVAIESPEKRCGKTTLLSVLAAMANKPLIASNVTVGALFRAIDTCRPTLFIDEADTFLAGSGTMRGIINSGNTWRTAYVLRLSRSKSQKSGDTLPRHSVATAGDSGLKRYSCWCPKVIAMIGKVPDTIADRSIVVPMTRKLITEIRAPLAELDPAIIKAKCARFALDEGQKIARHEKIRNKELNDRAADTFDPLYVVTRLAGQDWEKKLHDAALALSLSPGVQAKGAIAELLLDIHTIFFLTERKKMFSNGLLTYLREDEFAMKPTALNYLKLDECKLSDVLRPYGIKSSTIRIGKDVMRGYRAEDFSDAVARYVPNADVEARMQEMKRQGKLWNEVQAEKDSERHVVPMG
jgi:putative DNA primase/helicase